MIIGIKYCYSINQKISCRVIIIIIKVISFHFQKRLLKRKISFLVFLTTKQLVYHLVVTLVLSQKQWAQYQLPMVWATWHWFLWLLANRPTPLPLQLSNKCKTNLRFNSVWNVRLSLTNVYIFQTFLMKTKEFYAITQESQLMFNVESNQIIVALLYKGRECVKKRWHSIVLITLNVKSNPGSTHKYT